jgi:hypothetical protein
MMLRIAAVFTLLAGLFASAAFLNMMGALPTASPQARHLRAMKDRAAVPSFFEATSESAIAALPHAAPLASYEPIERRGVSIDGYVQRMLRAADGDIHLEIVPERRLPGEASLPYVTGEISRQWLRNTDTWTFPRLVEAFHPNQGGVTPWEGGTRRVRISGWLLNDYESGPAPFGPRRVSPWEIHPVTRIELWNDSLSAFQDFAR